MASRPDPPARKRVVVYCQHLSGAGHYVRSREIVRSLARRHQVWFVTGGSHVPGPPLAAEVHQVRLPGLRRTASGIAPLDPARSLDGVFTERSLVLDQLLRDLCCDLLLIEHFPFSKWALREELLSAIGVARSINPRVRVVSSVRDYPAGNEDVTGGEGLRRAVVPTLNEHFDAILVHADPRMVRLESLFAWTHEIAVPVHYTGYVSEKPGEGTCTTDSRRITSDTGYVLVSSGGLRDGLRLARLCAAAWRRLDDLQALSGRRMVIFAGLFAEGREYMDFEATLADGRFVLHPFGADFLGWLQNAELSISQGGYNTTMNALETRTRAILAPNRLMTDQTRRADALKRRGLVDVIDVETIAANEMARLIKDALARPRPEHELSLDGAQRTADTIDALLQQSNAEGTRTDLSWLHP
jgi:predicted glycosyltransferase